MNRQWVSRKLTNKTIQKLINSTSFCLIERIFFCSWDIKNNYTNKSGVKSWCRVLGVVWAQDNFFFPKIAITASAPFLGFWPHITETYYLRNITEKYYLRNITEKSYLRNITEKYYWEILLKKYYYFIYL